MIAEKTMRCSFCGRLVRTYLTPGGRVVMGHRETMPHTPETPWCDGGGRKPRGRAERPETP